MFRNFIDANAAPFQQFHSKRDGRVVAGADIAQRGVELGSGAKSLIQAALMKRAAWTLDTDRTLGTVNRI